MVKKKGMTLVELMVSMAFFLLSLAGITALIYQSTETSNTVLCTYTASNLARNRIEWIRELRRNKGYSAIAFLPEEQIDMIDSTGLSGEDFERTTKIEYSPNLTAVTVIIEYKKRETKKPLKVELVTLLSSYL